MPVLKFFKSPVKRIKSAYAVASVLGKELKVPTPFGHIAVKVWGDTGAPVVVCVHGFMENAASWDSLIPRLPGSLCYAAVDFPGHGLSSHIPSGCIYTDLCYAQSIEFIRRFFGVDRIGIIGHSMGAGISMLYTNAYHKRTDFFVSLDFVGYPFNRMEERLTHLGRRIDKALAQEKLSLKEKPLPWQVLLGGMLRGWGGSIDKRTAEVMAARSSSKVSDDQYKLTRDLKISNNQLFGVIDDMEFQPDYGMSVCLLEADRGIRFSGADARKRTLACYIRNHTYVEHHMLAGRHHFYHERPHVVAHYITQFLAKHYQLKNTQ